MTSRFGSGLRQSPRRESGRPGETLKKEKRQTESGSRAYLLRLVLGNVAGFCLTGGGLRRQWGTALCKGAAGIEVKV
jgi:hypothetical protein